MPIWTVERNRLGSSISRKAVRAPRTPSSAMCWSRDLRDDTTASSDIAKTPFKRVKATMMAISKTSMDQGFRKGDRAAAGTDWRREGRCQGGNSINRHPLNRTEGFDGTVSGGSE